MPDVLEPAGLREFDGRVLAVVVKALPPLTSPSAVSVTTTPESPLGTSTGVKDGAVAARLFGMLSSLNLIQLSMLDWIDVNID